MIGNIEREREREKLKERSSENCTLLTATASIGAVRKRCDPKIMLNQAYLSWNWNFDAILSLKTIVVFRVLFFPSLQCKLCIEFSLSLSLDDTRLNFSRWRGCQINQHFLVVFCSEKLLLIRKPHLVHAKLLHVRPHESVFEVLESGTLLDQGKLVLNLYLILIVID